SRRGALAWCIYVAAGLVEQGAALRTRDTLSHSASRIRMLAEPVAHWRGPASAPPQGEIDLSVPVTVLNACGTDHHLAAMGTPTRRLSAPVANQLQIDAHFDYHIDDWQLFACALEIGALTGAAGFVIGGTFGNWIGAAIGAILGFLVGFVGTLLFAS